MSRSSRLAQKYTFNLGETKKAKGSQEVDSILRILCVCRLLIFTLNRIKDFMMK